MSRPVRRGWGVCLAGLALTSAVTAPRGGAQGVRGVVYDSVGRAPLAGAHVQLVPVDGAMHAVARRTTHTDAAGAFAVDSLPAGRYLVGFFHPRLDSLGLDPLVKRVELRGGRVTTVELSVPSSETVVATWCGPKAATDSLGVVLGYTRDATSANTWGDARVSAQWRMIAISPRGARAEVQGASTQASPRGWFALCGVPRGGLVVLRASTDADSSATLEVDVPDDGVLRRDIAFARGTGAPTEIVRGVVRDAQGQPVGGARLRWWGSAVEVRADERGAYALPAAPGTQLLEARMIGFVPTRRVVDVAPGATHVDVELPEFPMEIDTVRVLARRPRAQGALAEFERRRQRGHGIFLDAAAIELRRPLTFTDLLRSMPGVEVRNADLMSRTVHMRSTNGLDACLPVLVIDGSRVPMLDMNLDDVIPAELVRAVEVYPRRMQAPPEFQGEDCGSIVIWTGVRGWLARPRAGASP
ncbi:MAG: carboxypeptidase regulatory-like domain-containing protein [Gemmatimonadetes bacterium]|nr:carboxypeptidase regulatory-like domain-containing protein [Gemmatimonadota bacterium]